MYDISAGRYEVYAISDGDIVIEGGSGRTRVGVFCSPDGFVLCIGWVNGVRDKRFGQGSKEIPSDFLRSALSELESKHLA
jgi:hypothetical protein